MVHTYGSVTLDGYRLRALQCACKQHPFGSSCVGGTMRNLIIGVIVGGLFTIAGSIKAPIAHARAPQVIGHGCTTAYFIDDDCDGCGVGVKSSGQYPLTQNPPAVGTPAYYTMGDTQDADDTDPTVCTTAQWQAKWGTANLGMVNFLQQRKGFTNTNRIFYLSPSGNNSTAMVNDPTHPYASMAPIMTALEDLQGGVVIIEGGTYTSGLYLSPCGDNGGNPCWELSGGPGHPLLVMAYPGEVARVTASSASGNGLDATGAYSPGRSDCCVIIDGLQFSAPTYGDGNGINAAYVSNWIIRNCEFAGWDKIIFSSHAVNALVENNVFHDMNSHAVYYAYDQGINQGPGDFNFALDEANYQAGQSEGASYNGQIIGNVMYGNGNSGYEPIHINAYMDYAVVEGNIVSYSGGTGMALETGVYNAWIAHNIFFDNGRDCITLYLYDHAGSPNAAATLRWNTIENNTCYVGSPTDVIRGTNPGGGIVQDDGTNESGHYIKDTTILNNVIVTYDNGVTTDQLPLKFETNSYPETDTIQGNLLWSTGPTTGRVMVVSNDASPNGGAGTYNLSQFQAFNANFSGNLYGNPQFESASPSFTLTPGAFNFAVPRASPAAGLGANLPLPLPSPPAVPQLPPAPAALGAQGAPSPPSNLTVTVQ